MPLVNAKCTNCGATLKVDNQQEAAVCEYCGSAYIVEKAINNYQIENHNTIHAQVVNIYGEQKNTVPISQKISNYIQKIKDSHDILLPPDELVAMLNVSYTSEQNNAVELKRLVTEYAKNININFDFSYAKDGKIYSDYSLKELWQKSGHKDMDYSRCRSGDNSGSYSIHWVTRTKTDSLKNYSCLTELQQRLTTYYIKMIKEGRFQNISLYYDGFQLWGVYSNSNYQFIDYDKKIENKYLIPYFSEGLQNAERINAFLSKIEEKRLYSYDYYIFSLGQHSIYLSIYISDGEKDTFVMERNDTNEHINFLKKSFEKKLEDRMKDRMKNKVCRYCGGTFKGVFSKSCTKCGKPKDY